MWMKYSLVYAKRLIPHWFKNIDLSYKEAVSKSEQPLLFC